jgi:hypothetical protein
MTDLNRFKAVARALADYVVGDTYAILNAADAVVSLDAEFLASQPVERPVITSPDGHATYNWDAQYDHNRWTYDHDYLVNTVLASEEAMERMETGQKIYAIKVLRAEVPRAGLAQCKRAVEDNRVTTAVKTNRDLAELRERLTGNPWDWSDPNNEHDPDEPPF